MKKKNLEKEQIKKKGKKIFSEFKEFIEKGNVVELAVGVIIGSAFGKIVNSLVGDILMPVIGIIIGGIDFSNLSVVIGSATVNYGMFIQNIIDFLIIAICVFSFVKIVDTVMNKAKKAQEVEEQEKEEKKDEQIILLEQIRDLLQNKSEERIG